MTEPAVEEAPPAEVPIVRDINSEPDDVLITLITAINNVAGAVDVGVTLHVGGLIITGQIIAGRVWFEAVAATVRQSAEGETEGTALLVDAIAGLYDTKAETYPKSFDDADMPEALRIGFVHLKDAVTVAPGLGRIHLGYWRVRLSEVAGWTQGIAGF